MLELRAGKNKIFIKAASLILAQVFLAASIVLPVYSNDTLRPAMKFGKMEASEHIGPFSIPPHLYENADKSQKPYLNILKQIVLEHKKRQEEGGSNEEKLAELDIKNIVELCQKRAVKINKFERFLNNNKIAKESFLSQIDSFLIDCAYDMLRQREGLTLTNSEFVERYPMENQKAAVLLNGMYERYGVVERERKEDSFEYRDGFALRVKKNVEMLRAREIEAFDAPSGQTDIEGHIFAVMKMDPNCYIGYGDMTKIAVMNKVFTSELVDALIPLAIDAMNVLLANYNIEAKAVRVSGDEIGLTASSNISPEMLNNIRLELQATLGEYIRDLYGFVKVEGVNDENQGAINEKLGKSPTKLTGVYKDKDGFFMVFDRRFSRSRSLKEACAKILDSVRKALQINAAIDGNPIEVPSPRFNLGFGIVKASKIRDELHANYGISMRHAEYVRNISNEHGLNGALSEMVRDLDKFDENIEQPTIPKLSVEERRQIADKYTKNGIKLYYDQIDEYYPAINRKYLNQIIQKMNSAEPGSAFLIRGPPDNFYIVAKSNDGEILLMKKTLIYEPNGDTSTRLEEKLRTGELSKNNLREKWSNGYGFKVINELYDHQTANEALRIMTEIWNQVVLTNVRVASLSEVDIKAIDDDTSLAVSRDIKGKTGIDVGVKIITTLIEKDGENILPGQDIDIVDDMVKIYEPQEALQENKVLIYDKDKQDEFSRKVAKNRTKERKAFYPVLQEAYKKPVLTNADLQTYKRIEGVEPNDSLISGYAIKGTIVINEGAEKEKEAGRITEELGHMMETEVLNYKVYGEDFIFHMNIIFVEMLANAVRHGQGDIVISYYFSKEKIELKVENYPQEGFDPAKLPKLENIGRGIPDPRDAPNLIKTSGRGILMIGAFLSKYVCDPEKAYWSRFGDGKVITELVLETRALTKVLDNKARIYKVLLPGTDRLVNVCLDPETVELMQELPAGVTLNIFGNQAIQMILGREGVITKTGKLDKGDLDCYIDNNTGGEWSDDAISRAIRMRHPGHELQERLSKNIFNYLTSGPFTANRLVVKLTSLGNGRFDIGFGAYVDVDAYNDLRDGKVSIIKEIQKEEYKAADRAIQGLIYHHRYGMRITPEAQEFINNNLRSNMTKLQETLTQGIYPSTRLDKLFKHAKDAGAAVEDLYQRGVMEWPFTAFVIDALLKTETLHSVLESVVLSKEVKSLLIEAINRRNDNLTRAYYITGFDL